MQCEDQGEESLTGWKQGKAVFGENFLPARFKLSSSTLAAIDDGTRPDEDFRNLKMVTALLQLRVLGLGLLQDGDVGVGHALARSEPAICYLFKSSSL
jgi:hypothetical protein